ncbi:MAG: ATPase domain-containing protein [Methanobacteriota archaeon]
MAQGVEWVEPARGHEGTGLPKDLEDEVRELRDQMRRLQDQVRALAVGRKATNDRVPTHIEGFDAALGGGIPRGHAVVLAGPTGAMKTSLALYTLTRNRANGMRGVYVTIEEGRDSIAETMRRLGLGDAEDAIVDIGRLRLEHAGAEDVRDWMQVLRDYLERRHEKEAIGLVVIDSLNALSDLARLRSPRGDLFHFMKFLEDRLGVTTILIVETDDAAATPLDGRVQNLADGILELRFSGAGEGRVELLLRCAKMRHATHSRDYFVLSYADRRFVARPYAEGSRGGRGRRG